MKTTFRSICLLLAVGFALAAVAQFAGLIPGISKAVLPGGFVACAALAFMLGDYQRKPAFRVRRSVDVLAGADATVNRPAGQAPDWTYTTRTK